jgi:NodT family efflux transporter outer membrane factor (OMF) lipoprotein
MRNGQRIILAAWGLATLAGCSLHRPQEVPLPVEPPGAYLEQRQASSGPAIERWWESFGDARLDELMTEMFARNLELESVFARLEQARATVRGIRSAQLPFVNIEGEGGRSMQPSFAGDFTGDNRRLSAAAGFEIDLWGKLAARTKASKKEAQATLEELHTLFLGLSSQLADLYYLAVEQRSQLELADRTIASFGDTLRRVEERYRGGLVPALDVYQARQSLAEAQASRHVFEANLAAAEHAVAVLLGRYPDRRSAGELAVLPTVPELFLVGLPAELVARRPDLKAALRRVEAADARVASAIAERFPSVNLLGSYGNSRQDFSTGLIEGDFWSLLGNLVAPVVDGGRRRAEVDRSRAALREGVARYQQAVLDAFREVEDALADNRADELRIARLEETEAATASALRLSLERYLQGLADYLPVLTAQRSHFDIQSRLLSARRRLISDRISLARALGGDWMVGEVQERLTSTKYKGSNS